MKVLPVNKVLQAYKVPRDQKEIKEIQVFKALRVYRVLRDHKVIPVLPALRDLLEVLINKSFSMTMEMHKVIKAYSLIRLPIT
jgi:hypothetical protein